MFNGVFFILVVPPYSLQVPYEQLGESFSAEFCAHITFQMAKLEDKVYVLYKAPNRIHVYNISKPYSILEEFSVKHLQSPCDVAACATSNCLYVTDQETRCIWKIVPRDRQVTRWLSDLGEPFTVSVSNDGGVIIPRDGQPSFVEIYNSDAVLILSVRLPEEIQHPTRVVETPTGNIIILHRCRDDLSSVVLSEVTANGNIVNRFAPGDDEELLNDGCRLAIVIDSDDFVVFTSDCDNNRAIVFDSKLEKGEIVNFDDADIEDDNTNTEE